MEQILKRNSPLDLKTAIAKAKHYCSTRDRSQQELRDKLYDLGAWRNEVEETIAEMIVEGFLSEERFAMAYVSAKFKLHGWGKIKLKKGLRDRRVPEKLIQQALNTIDPEDYTKTLLKHAEKHLSRLKERITWRRKLKLTDFLLRQGYEYITIHDVLKTHGELK